MEIQCTKINQRLIIAQLYYTYIIIYFINQGMFPLTMIVVLCCDVFLCILVVLHPILSRLIFLFCISFHSLCNSSSGKHVHIVFFYIICQTIFNYLRGRSLADPYSNSHLLYKDTGVTFFLIHISLLYFCCHHNCNFVQLLQ